MNPPRAFLRVAVLVVASFFALAAAARAQCPVAPDASWTPTEAWVWSNVCIGNFADLSQQDNAPVSMTGAAPWPADRTLSAEFIADLLTDPRFALKLYPGPIIIAGARFTDPVRIINATLTNALILSNSRFDGGLDIEDTTSSKGLFLAHDLFAGDLMIKRSAFQLFELNTSVATALDIEEDRFDDHLQLESVGVPSVISIKATSIGAGGLTLRSAHGVASRIGGMTLLDSKIAGSVSISDAQFAGRFDGGRTIFKSGFDIANSSFAAGAFFSDADFVRTVDVDGTSFNNDLEFDTSKFESTLALYNDNFCLQGPSCELFMAGASFGNKVSIEHVLIHGDINADDATASGSFELLNDGNAQFPLGVKMMNADFSRDLSIGSTTLAYLQIPNAGISGALQLLLAPGDWAKNSHLTLEGTNIGVLTNPSWVWPDTMFLEGMHFGLIGIKTVDLDQGCIDGGWSNWLGKMSSYSPEPYQQVAKYLTDSGNASAASCVLETGKKKSLAGEKNVVRQAIYWTYGKVAGYGYAPEQAFAYVLLFVLLGMLVLRVTGQGRKNGMPLGLVYSFSQLIPLVSLDKRFDDIELTGAARYYFYLHKIVGYVIAIFVGAALGSLSGKS